MAGKFGLNDASRVIDIINNRIDAKTRTGAMTEETWGTVSAISADQKTASAYIYGDVVNPSVEYRVPDIMYLAVGDAVKVAINHETGERWIEERLFGPTDYKKMYIRPSVPAFYMGDGTGVPDSNFYRSAVATLKTDGAFIAGGTVTATTGLTLGADASISRTAANEISLAAGDVLRLPQVGDASLASTDHAFQIGASGSTNIAMDNNEVMARNNGAAATLNLNTEGGRVLAGADIEATTDYRLNGRSNFLPARVEGWVREDAPANQTSALDMYRFGITNTNPFVTRPVLGRAGRVVGVMWRKTGTVATGSFQLSLGVSGQGTTDVILFDSSVTATSGYTALGTPITFTSGNSIYMYFTTTSDYTATTIDYAADILVEYSVLA